MAERFPVGDAPLTATWLAERQTVNGTGTLVDISSGGFAARMIDAPAPGRLLHARFFLDTPVCPPTKPIEADARVCGRAVVRHGDDLPPEWIVNFAIESIHPVDEKLMARAMGILKTASAS